ncbi:anti-sigma factor domain-containing protein [Heliobacillus mobilis]|uniref:Anti-sigma factor domain-containing protein n=1 Tax=Heliobacterium mobile TaxID=28064 RepID=A0A6I3SN02_HELMO|nr:anti-sigma factor domain-containing protein [Heliobacterium mobile]MTV49707.1 anti-sigma factor domain-containing protein [Heliobacterium mobile]
MDERGVVMEIQGNDVIVLTPSGEFRRERISPPAPQIGDEILLTPVNKPQLKENGRASSGGHRSRQGNQWYMVPWKWAFPAVAAVLLFMVNVFSSGTTGLNPSPEKLADSEALPTYVAAENKTLPAGEPVKFVTIDINPSIELGLDENDLVISVRSLNQDAEKLLTQRQLQGLHVEEAVALITDEAVKLGYLASAKDNAVVIAVTGQNKEPVGNQTLVTRLQVSARAAMEKEKLSADKVHIVRVPKESREQAGQMGLSVGKYAIYLEALDRGLQVKPDDLKKASITKAIASAGGNPTEIIQKAVKDENLSLKAEKYKDEIGKRTPSAEQPVKQDPPRGTTGSSESKPEESKPEDPLDKANLITVSEPVQEQSKDSPNIGSSVQPDIPNENSK